MSIALHGNLRDFGIAEVFQLVGQQRKTGTLVVGEGSDAVFLSFDEGRVVNGGVVDSGGEGGSLGRQLVVSRGERCRQSNRDEQQREEGYGFRSVREIPFAHASVTCLRVDDAIHASSRADRSDNPTPAARWDLLRQTRA